MGASTPTIPAGTSTENGSQYQSFTFDPTTAKQVSGLSTGLLNSLPGYADAATKAAKGMTTNFSSFVPKLNTTFAGPNFSTGLDAFSQNTIAKGVQDANAKVAAGNARIGQQFGASNPILAAILQRQNETAGQLGTNPMLFEAAANQRQREGEEYQLGTQAQTYGNNALLQQAQAGAQAAATGNQALTQQAQLSQAPMQAGSNLLSILTALGAMTGTRVATSSGTTAQAPTTSNTPPALPQGKGTSKTGV